FNLTNITDKGNAQFIGLLGGESLGTTISNVHATDLTISTDASACVGGLVGNLALYSTVSDCSISAANIEAINGTNVGGIVGASHTTSAIKACAFSGELDGNNAVGGIAGSSDGNCEIRNCHVSADIYANHTVGGILGSSKRDVVANNYIEGYITSMIPSWDGPATGGVIGYLDSDYTGNDTKIITGNVVALNQILAATSESEPSWETQYLTAHRIVGRTAVNEEAEIVDYDRSQSDWWNYPIYGDPLPADLGLANNYAVSDLPSFDAEITGADSTEGASIDRASINQEFLAGIDFAFGEATDTPWKESAAAAVLYFEDAAQAIALTVAKEESTEVVLTFPAVLGSKESGINVSYSADGVVFVNPLDRMGNASAKFDVVGLEEGVVDVTITYLGATLVLNITVGPAGVSDITIDHAQTITFDGTTVKADGAIRVYNAAGIQVAAGSDAVAVDHLTPGIYVAVSNDSTLKFRK
ncbi:MAG: GLUG motif-containing protein, partial [Muribaculaceae bacterium]